jgi:hypothetical protein
VHQVLTAACRQRSLLQVPVLEEVLVLLVLGMPLPWQAHG